MENLIDENLTHCLFVIFFNEIYQLNQLEETYANSSTRKIFFCSLYPWKFNLFLQYLKQILAFKIYQSLHTCVAIKLHIEDQNS